MEHRKSRFLMIRDHRWTVLSLIPLACFLILGFLWLLHNDHNRAVANTHLSENFRPGRLHEVQVGKSTLDDVERLFGPPLYSWDTGMQQCYGYSDPVNKYADYVIYEIRFDPDGRVSAVYAERSD